MQSLYDTETAALYASLGIKGTTYQVSYDAAVAEVGSLQGKRVLDIGCGAGRSTQFLKFLNPDELIGLDHNEAMLGQARSRNLQDVSFVLAGSHEASLVVRPESFDAVFAFSVYCEFSSLAQMMQLTANVFSYLKPGGIYCVATTNPLCSGADFINFHYEETDHKDLTPWPCHMHTDPPFVIEDTYWSIETFDNVFHENGFELVKKFFPLAKGEGWRDETRVAPQVVYNLSKPNR